MNNSVIRNLLYSSLSFSSLRENSVVSLDAMSSAFLMGVWSENRAHDRRCGGLGIGGGVRRATADSGTRLTENLSLVTVATFSMPAREAKCVFSPPFKDRGKITFGFFPTTEN